MTMAKYVRKVHFFLHFTTPGSRFQVWIIESRSNPDPDPQSCFIISFYLCAPRFTESISGWIRNFLPDPERTIVKMLIIFMLISKFRYHKQNFYVNVKNEIKISLSEGNRNPNSDFGIGVKAKISKY
jgi:hypothetical protein